MKAILKFDLDDIDDRINHFRALMANEMAWALMDVLYVVKKLERFEDDENIDKYQYINELSKAISEIFDEHNLDINRLNN